MARPKNFMDVVSRLPGAKVKGNKAIAPCPLLGHKTPQGHLTITDGGDKCLITDQGGRHSYEDICQALGFDSLTYSPNGNGAEIIATYDYTDAGGKLLYQVVRYAPKDFRQRRPDGDGAWVWNLKGVKPVLYRLPEVKRAITEGRTVYICEGEKDTDALRDKGMTATTNSGGAEKWRPEYAEVLTDASVVILPDRDAPGQRHALQVANSIYGKAKSIKILKLPDRDGHQVKDISDWLAIGGTMAELEGLTARVPEYKPKENEGVSLVCIADIDPETVSWLWLPYIPKGKLTLLEGDPGVGKSWVSLAIATAISTGKGLPGTEAIESARVLLASAEDGLGDTIRPRLDAMGADVTRIHAIKGAFDFGNSGLAKLERFIKDIKPSLVIIDPLVAYIGAGIDLHRANETRAVMARLAEMAERYTVTILAVRHLTKGGTLKPIYRGLGSIDLAAACRSVLMAGCDPDNPQKRGIVHIKSNLAPMGKAIGYELRDGGFYWTGESDLTATRILSIEDSGEVKTARDEAADFLRDELADGPVEAAQVWRDAREAGLAEATLKRAKAMLGIITKRHGEAGKRGGGKFTWELPGGNLEAQRDLEYQEYHIKNGDTLNNSSFKNNLLPKASDTLNIPEILGMPMEKAIELWCSEGAPVIYLGNGENCFDLKQLLSTPCNERQLEAVKAWLKKRMTPN
jgi:putative DNA primase/helicase